MTTLNSSCTTVARQTRLEEISKEPEPVTKNSKLLMILGVEAVQDILEQAHGDSMGLFR
jgi:hypothetical protein